MDIGETIYKLRRSKGLSQEELGEALGVTRQTVSKWENGQALPETEKLIDLAHLFNVSIDSILTGKEFTTTVVKEYYHPYEYEYKSKMMIFGLPLVHINVGLGFKRAKGIIAIGNVATGILSLGIVSVGIVSLGAVSVGLIALGALALALFMAFGAVAIGIIAFGALALGVFAYGGVAIASHLAVGGIACGKVGIGDEVRALYAFSINQNVSGSAVRNALHEAYPNLARWIIQFVTFMF